MILYKVFYKKYSKDDPKIIGSERVNDHGNWENNLLGSPDWNSGVISIKEGHGTLIRKAFVTRDSSDDLLFEGDKFTINNNESKIYTIPKIKEQYDTTLGLTPNTKPELKLYTEDGTN